MTAVKKLDTLKVDPVAGGFYTVREAARLLNISSTVRITGWLQGRTTSALGAVLNRQYAPIERVQELGFWDLLEVRFVDHFRARGVSLQSLRKAAETARELWSVQHPFATSKAKYLTDRKDIFQSTAEETKDSTLLNLVTRQYAMYVVLEEVLDKGMAFDPATGIAREWRPSPKEFPNIALNPRVAFGRPVVLPVAVPTSAIFRTWKAEDGSYSAVSDWYGIEEALAREAVEFELGLPN